jgi:hypothetical protein
MPECEWLETCGFVRKYQNTKNLACQGFIASYCKGPSMEECVRLDYFNNHGVRPPDDMTPTGHMLKDGLLQRSL